MNIPRKLNSRKRICPPHLQTVATHD